MNRFEMLGAEDLDPRSELQSVGLPRFTVGLADPDVDRRTTLARTLRIGGLDIAATYSNANDLVEVAGHDFEAAVLGTDRLDPEALESAILLRETGQGMKVVVVAEQVGNGPTREAFDVGVDAVVWVRDAGRCLALAVRSARAGQLSVPKSWRKGFQTPVLSRRQKQILAMVVMGFSNRRIARTLGVAESTVKSHLTSAFRRLDVSSRNEAAALILDPENGLGTGILGIPTDGNAAEPIRANPREDRGNSTNK